MTHWCSPSTNEYIQYERTLPVYNGTVVSDGIVYMVSSAAQTYITDAFRRLTETEAMGRVSI